MGFPYPPSVPLDDLATLGTVLTGGSKLTDPADIRAVWAVGGYALSIIRPVNPAMAANFTGPHVDPTPAAVAAHIKAGLAAQNAIAFQWNWAAIWEVVYALLKLAGVTLP